VTTYSLGDARPTRGEGAWIAPGAHVIGDVRLGASASVWFGAVIRGDNTPILIGERTNVQDGAVLHSDPGFPLTVGNEVTVGHRAILHGCTVGDGALVGMGAIVLNGAVIGAECLVGAGALVTEGKVFPARMLVVGAPARVVRELTDEEVARLRLSAASYTTRAGEYDTELRPCRGDASA